MPKRRQPTSRDRGLGGGDDGGSLPIVDMTPNTSSSARLEGSSPTSSSSYGENPNARSVFFWKRRRHEPSAHEEHQEERRESALVKTTTTMTPSRSTLPLHQCPPPPSSAPAETVTTYHRRPARKSSAMVLSALIALVGALAGGTIIGLGVARARHEQNEDFRLAAQHIVEELKVHWESYFRSAKWVHGACHRNDHDDDGSQGDERQEDDGTTTNATTTSSVTRLCSRRHFRDLYRHLDLPPCTGLGFVPNVTHNERPSYESESRAWFDEVLPSFHYRGFRGPLPVDGSTLNATTYEPRDFYFPVQYVEPLTDGFEKVSGLDMYSCCRDTVEQAVRTGRPALTPRVLFRRGDAAAGVLFLHPGLHADAQSSPSHRRPIDLALMVVRIPALLNASFSTSHGSSISTYLFDSTPIANADDYSTSIESDVYLGGAHVRPAGDNLGDVWVEMSQEPQGLEQLRRSDHRHHHEETLEIAFRTWTIFITADDISMARPLLYFACIGGATIIVACIVLSFWMWRSWRRQAAWHILEADAEAERASLLLESAKRSARHERELNDFIAHEVRNPLAAAISACSFVTAAVVVQEPDSQEPQEDRPGISPSGAAAQSLFSNESTRRAVQEDLGIIETSLHFINDLLRNMLDMQRAQANQLQIHPGPVDLGQDVLKAVDALLYRRGGCVRVEVDCPPNLIVWSDRLRLKQIVLNLGRNALKFVGQVQAGSNRQLHVVVDDREEESCGGSADGNASVVRDFIRLRAGISPQTGLVQIFVEDSGPGIPIEKRQKLFMKFQESLDSLHQGTGIGLCLCQTLTQLMGGDIWLDESYHSGIEGCPGSRFVIDLKVPPMIFADEEGAEEEGTATTIMAPAQRDAEEGLAESAVGMPQPNTLAHIDSHPRNLPIVGEANSASSAVEREEQRELPENLSVLFVDDDVVLRKLFARVLRKVAPASWSMEEAVNGESAIQLIEERAKQPQQQDKEGPASPSSFDLIFVDMYMSSVEQQLLGTDTVRAMRARGVPSVICGLSANDVEDRFVGAGADAFMFKPFPTKPAVLKAKLARMLQGYDPSAWRGRRNDGAASAAASDTAQSSTRATSMCTISESCSLSSQ